MPKTGPDRDRPTLEKSIIISMTFLSRGPRFAQRVAINKENTMGGRNEKRIRISLGGRDAGRCVFTNAAHLRAASSSLVFRCCHPLIYFSPPPFHKSFSFSTLYFSCSLLATSTWFLWGNHRAGKEGNAGLEF